MPNHHLIKKILTLVLNWYLLSSLTYGSSSKSNQQSFTTLPIPGHFTSHNTIDSMWLTPPKIIANENDCLGACTSYINFSNPNIPPIKIENCIGGLPTNLGDLDQNGTDEIGLLPQWFTSNWSAYYVYTYHNGKWVYAVPPFSTHTNQWVKGVIPIESDKNKAGYVIIRYSELSGDNIVIKSKSIKF